MENENPMIKESRYPQYEIVIESGFISNVSQESIFQLIRNIRDPEHPYTLEQLSIVSLEDVKIEQISNDKALCQAGLPLKQIKVVFTPTIPHCSMAGIIGLAILYQLLKHVKGYEISVGIKENTHNTYLALNKQLSDNDRIMAAFENDGMVELIESCLPYSE